MSQSFPPSPEPTGDPEQPGQPESAPELPGQAEQPVKSGQPARVRVALGRLVPRRRGARWAALGAVVVIVGGGAAAACELDHHGREDRGGHFAEAGPGYGSYGERGHHNRHGKDGQESTGQESTGQAWNGRDQALAPAPLPAVPAAQAAEKAAATVPGGRVEALQVIGQQGGGSAWQAVVLGADGVRHDVTLAGADGSVTGNAVADGQ